MNDLKKFLITVALYALFIFFCLLLISVMFGDVFRFFVERSFGG